MITREADYAIRTVLHLAVRCKDGCVTTTELSKTMEIPYRFLRKLVVKLTMSGLVESRKGRGGGLFLAREPAAISLLDVISSVAPDAVRVNRCTGDDGQCDRSCRCAIHEGLSVLQTELNAGLARIRFDTLAERDLALR